MNENAIQLCHDAKTFTLSLMFFFLFLCVGIFFMIKYKILDTH